MCEKNKSMNVCETSEESKTVAISGICSYKAGELTEYTVKICYTDTVLIISMLHDYMRMLQDLQGQEADWYRNRFASLTKTLEEGIEYDYKKMLEKCEGGRPERDDRLGENWIGA